MSKAIELSKLKYYHCGFISSEVICPEDSDFLTTEQAEEIIRRCAALADTEAENKRLKTIEKYLIEHKKAIEEDERYHYKTATVFENAPLALIQFGMKAETALINQALNAKKEEVCKTCGGSEEVAISVDFSHHHNVPDYKTCPDCKNEKVKNETM